MLKTNLYMKAYLNVIDEDVNTINIKKYQSIANEIGGVYISEINTIDCKGNKVRFENGWINDEGSFDFKLINTSNDCSYMFYRCNKLIYLPDNFIIPNTVTDCSGMFCNCKSLTHLPNNFIMPNSIKDCSNMFASCKSLTYLPDNFTIPNTVTDCSYMFYNCNKLTHLPENFTIPESVTDCSNMFSKCTNLSNIPTNFHIPSNTNYSFIFYGCSKLENKDSESYIMVEI